MNQPPPLTRLIGKRKLTEAAISAGYTEDQKKRCSLKIVHSGVERDYAKNTVTSEAGIQNSQVTEALGVQSMRRTYGKVCSHYLGFERCKNDYLTMWCRQLTTLSMCI